MAHADYNCCAICDSKLDYSHEAESKGEICTSCLKALRNNGVNVLDVEEFINWIQSTDKNAVLKVLKNLHFSFCYYKNFVDEAVKKYVPEYKGGLHE